MYFPRDGKLFVLVTEQAIELEVTSFLLMLLVDVA
jgi:hypothetical protein